MAVTVLVVNADPHNCTDWGTLLSDQGYDVIAARNAEAALTICPSLRPDLVLLSDLLPDMHGLELCRRNTTCENIQNSAAHSVPGNPWLLYR